jgi:hypothetical protein
MKKNILFIVYILMFVLGSGTLLQLGYRHFQHIESRTILPGDVYDPSLSRLNTMSKFEAFVDSLALVRDLTSDSIPDYVNLIDSIVQMRFYHGLQNYRFADNWLANLSGKYIWSHFGAKVLPDDILKGQKAFCSQSSIVFQEILRRKQISVRSVLLPGHFCTEVLVEDHWKFYDVSFKPVFAGLSRMSTHELALAPQYVEKAYLYSFARSRNANFQQYFDLAHIEYGEVNAFAAPNMRLFHRVTGFLSMWGWLVFLGFAFLLRKRKA